MLLNCGVEDSWESLGLQGGPTSPFWRRSVLNIHWKDWCWSWNSNTFSTWCEELTHLKRPWCWERLKVGGEGDDRGRDGWMVSPIRWTWVWASSRSWWWTGNPGVLQSMGLQNQTWLKWTGLMPFLFYSICFKVYFILFEIPMYPISASVQLPKFSCPRPSIATTAFLPFLFSWTIIVLSPYFRPMCLLLWSESLFWSI